MGGAGLERGGLSRLPHTSDICITSEQKKTTSCFDYAACTLRYVSHDTAAFGQVLLLVLIHFTAKSGQSRNSTKFQI